MTKQSRKMSERYLVSSGSRFEPEVGFSRAVRVGAHISVAGTAPISATGGNAALGDVYGQTKRCLEIIDAAIAEAGGSLQNVTRTRVMLIDMTTWREAARAHREYFGAIRPACTFVQCLASSTRNGSWRLRPTLLWPRGINSSASCTWWAMSASGH